MNLESPILDCSAHGCLRFVTETNTSATRGSGPTAGSPLLRRQPSTLFVSRQPYTEHRFCPVGARVDLAPMGPCNLPRYVQSQPHTAVGILWLVQAALQRVKDTVEGRLLNGGASIYYFHDHFGAFASYCHMYGGVLRS